MTKSGFARPGRPVHIRLTRKNLLCTKETETDTETFLSEIILRGGTVRWSICCTTQNESRSSKLKDTQKYNSDKWTDRRTDEM